MPEVDVNTQKEGPVNCVLRRTKKINSSDNNRSPLLKTH